jgi:LPS-assembly protein
MSVRKSNKHLSMIANFLTLMMLATPHALIAYPLQRNMIAEQLGWVPSSENHCGGYYLDDAFQYPVKVDKNDVIAITGHQGLYAQRGVSNLVGGVTINRFGQQITADKALLYRDPETYKLTAIDMIGDVHLREPNTLIVSKKGFYNLKSKSKTLMDVLYRTTLNGRQIAGPKTVSHEAAEKKRKITSLTAWGEAHEISQNEPQVYELSKASFTTCPPINPSWSIHAGHIVLDKNAGRGYATNARLAIRQIPIFYTPYISFPLDNRRKSGFLWPTYGGSSASGPSFFFPFYWNIAPNYDMTITPAALFKRGLQLSDKFRYLTTTSSGFFDVAVLPNDRFFSIFQRDTKKDPPVVPTQPIPVTLAEVNRLLNASPTRRSLIWRDKSRFDEHWSSHIDFNYVSDDYYMRDFGNVNQITQNQLLQEGDIFYKSQNWDFIGRLQTYQTLHPYNEKQVLNQYRRFPQLILNGDYPEQRFGLEYFINSEVTHFDILNTPGTQQNSPIGNRLHAQPGVSLPFVWPYFYITPRAQAALTEYNLYQTNDTGTPTTIRRAVPIFDVASGMTLNRDTQFFHHRFQQTLEPQIYYTYIPYRGQSDIPLFDTTVNELSYDQIFNYNRFTGIDRIGDANQIGLGVSTRFIDQETGFEKIRIGAGDIVYFANRIVTLCNDDSCSDNPTSHGNYQRLSPLTGLFEYHVNPAWKFGANAIWDPILKQLGMSTLGLNYKPDEKHILNFVYTYARTGDWTLISTDSKDNLKVTDFSFIWPVPFTHDFSAVGRWSQNWNQRHLQNLLYGLQYDTCCWAVQLVGGRAFRNLDTANNNKPTYNGEFYFQFSLKGLGEAGYGNTPLSAITGYNPATFGQDV